MISAWLAVKWAMDAPAPFFVWALIGYPSSTAVPWTRCPLGQKRRMPEEGVILSAWLVPRVLAMRRGEVTSLVCQRMALGEPDASGRRTPVPIPDSEFTLSADTVVVAIGQGPNQVLIRNIGAVKLNRRGYIEVVEETGATNVPASTLVETSSPEQPQSLQLWGWKASRQSHRHLPTREAQADASDFEAAPAIACAEVADSSAKQQAATRAGLPRQVLT